MDLSRPGRDRPHPRCGPRLLSRGERRALWLTTSGAALTGGLYAILAYLLEQEDPFQAYNHWLQPWALQAHIVGVPLLVFAVGWVFSAHVMARLRDTPSRRASGVSLIVLFVIMVLSGYLLQVASSDIARVTLAWTHGITGALWALLFVGHAWTGRRLRERS